MTDSKTKMPRFISRKEADAWLKRLCDADEWSYEMLAAAVDELHHDAVYNAQAVQARRRANDQIYGAEERQKAKERAA